MQIPHALAVVLTVVAAAGVIAVPWLIRTERRARRLGRALHEAEVGTARAEQALQALRIETDTCRVDLRDVHEELRHLGKVRLPGLITHLAHPHVPVPPLDNPRWAGTELGELQRQILDVVASGVRDERIRVDEAAQDILRRTAAGSRTLSQQMQRILIEAQDRFEDPQILDSLVKLDHLNERTKRLWQIMAVACGDSTGLSRVDSHLEDLVAGAQARIESYQLIRPVNNLSVERRVGVVAHAAEPVAVILAELMANAAYFSTGTVPVSVAIHETATGALVVIDDAGPGIHPDDREFVDRMTSGSRRVLLTELGSPPRLGFAGIGRLVREYPIDVNVSVSQYGGVHAAVHIAKDLLVSMDPVTQPVSAAAAVPVGLLRQQSRASTPEAAAAALPATAPDGMPRRRRQRPDPKPVSLESERPQDADEVRHRFAGFQDVTRQHRVDADRPKYIEGNPT
ncbi:sensor histidine kinase [Embleya sp. NPDC050154]|uniref:ATP-binding protein n=1 Tax=unclassified Embleya TaxID=2699296 RepID=UPI00379D361E